MKKVFIAGGGTGGHFYPASVISEHLKEKGYQVYYFGTKNGIEARKKFPSDKTFLFDIKAVRVKGILRKISGTLSILKTTFDIYKIVKKENPDFAICFGGYTSMPLGLAIFLARKSLYIHEQNSIPSYSNKILSFFAKKIFITFEFTKKYFPKKKTYLTGIPIRKSVKESLNLSKKRARESLNIPLDKRVVLIFGGSQGAKRLNEIVPNLANQFKDIVFLHIEGKHKAQNSKKLKNLITFDYFEDIGILYKACDLVISRAGASTVNEILIFGKKAIFIPFPFAASNHQFYNVKWLEDIGLCKIVDEKNLETLPKILKNFLDENINDTYMKKLAILNAEEKIFKLIKEDANTRKC